MKSIMSLLLEMPPPKNWDLSVFKKSFKKQLDYALQMATKLGSGSSRVVFEIKDDTGHSTVLKIAKNAKGLAQNTKEADYSINRMYKDITIPLLDHDQEHDQPKWLQFEKADKLTNQKFKAIEGFSFAQFSNMLQAYEIENNPKMRGWRIDYRKDIPEHIQEEIEQSNIYQETIDLCMIFDLLIGDMCRLCNWGIYRGRAVIIDMGFDSAIQKLFYTPKVVNRW
jgi:hypothetical protein